MKEDKNIVEDLSTMVEIVSEEQEEEKKRKSEERKTKANALKEAINALKGDRPEKKGPKKVEPPTKVNNSSVQPTANPPQSNKVKGSYMEIDAWFRSDTDSEEVNNKFTRAKNHMEYQEWEDAIKKFKEILLLEPNNAGASMGIFLAKEKMQKPKELGSSGRDIDVKQEKELSAAYTDGNSEQKRFIEEALASRRKQNAYIEATKLAGKFDKKKDLEKAEKKFIVLGDFSDSATMAKCCRDAIRKLDIIEEAGKYIAEGRDRDATKDVIKNAFDNLESLRSKNKDIIGNDLDSYIDELQQKLDVFKKKEKEKEQERKRKKKNKIGYNSLAVAFLIISIIIGPLNMADYGAVGFLKYLPLPFLSSTAAFEGEAPYVISFATGNLKLEMNGDYTTEKYFIPSASRVWLVLGNGSMGINPVFPKNMNVLEMYDYRAGTLVVPEGTKTLYLTNVSIQNLVLPSTLESFYAVNAQIASEVNIPEGCSANWK